MSENKTGRYFKYAIGEILLVVIGILIALQINNWNESRKEAVKEQIVLKKLVIELNNDVQVIKEVIEGGRLNVAHYKFCLNVLSNQVKTDRNTFRKRFFSTVVFLGFDINRTTFNSITESRTIDFIKNNQLVDSLNAFYNSDYVSWDTASRDYTRNIIAPYLMKFDYLPTMDEEILGSNFDDKNFTQVDLSKFEVNAKTIEDYKKDIFIINLLRQRLYLTEGQIVNYKALKNKMESLVKQIEAEIKYD